MGRIAAPFGIRGWVKVAPWSEDPATLLAHAVWYLREPDAAATWRAVEVVSARPHANVLVAELRGVASREAAAALRGHEIGLPRQALSAPARNEYFWTDLEGLEVVNRAGANLGRVTAVTSNGAHAILRVAGRDRVAERLIPFVPAYIDRVDAERRRIDVDWEPDF
jgi:16S rRNA processing protein RimM